MFVIIEEAPHTFSKSAITMVLMRTAVSAAYENHLLLIFASFKYRQVEGKKLRDSFDFLIVACWCYLDLSDKVHLSLCSPHSVAIRKARAKAHSILYFKHSQSVSTVPSTPKQSDSAAPPSEPVHHEQAPHIGAP